MDVIQVRLDIPAETHRRLKHRAVDEGKTFSKLLRELVEAGERAKPVSESLSSGNGKGGVT